jgi:hypothetical protein
MMRRGFFHSPQWMAARNALPGTQRQAFGAATADIDLVAKDLSIRGRLDGLVEAFAVGWPRSKLVRPQGFGMDPPFSRMRSPHEAVVEMRTQHTRTFGFFVGKDLFVALRLDLADRTHEHPELYQQHAEGVMKVVTRMASSEKDETSDIEVLIGDFPDEQPE